MKRDSTTLRFSLRERTFLSTQAYTDQTWKGQTFQVTISPWDALVQTTTGAVTDGYPTAGISMYAPIVRTLACFKRFKHIGTKIAIIPAAGRPAVDPAHISDTGTQNYVNPYDIANHWCVRKWIGDDFRIPDINTSDVTPERARQLDALYLSDKSWRKLAMSQGWHAFIRPLKCDVEITGYGLMAYGQHPKHTGHSTRFNSLAGMAFPSAETDSSVPDASSPEVQFADEFDPLLPSRRYRARGWIPNPFAAFTWANSTAGGSGEANGRIYPASVYTDFPWFASGEYPSGVAPTSTDVGTIKAYCSMARNVLICPACLVHIPPAYSTRFYWTVYMRHYFAATDPVLTTGTWTAAKWHDSIGGNDLKVEALSPSTEEYATLPNMHHVDDFALEEPEEIVDETEQPSL